MKKNPIIESMLHQLNSAKQSQSHKAKATYIAFVLDESGSMAHGKDLTLQNFNQQLATIRRNEEAGGKTRVSFFTFSDSVRLLCHEALPHKVSDLTSLTYRPGGDTALYDGIGYALNEMEKIDTSQEDAAFLVCILTDGEERCSRYFRPSQIGERVRALQATGHWTFTLMGPDTQLRELSDVLGIPGGNVSGFVPESLESRQTVVLNESTKMFNYMTARSVNLASAHNLYVGPELSG